MRLLLFLGICLMASSALAQDASASAPVAPPGWVGALSNPLVGGLIVAILTQVIKWIPSIPVEKGGRVAAVAAVLSVLVGFVSAYASGNLTAFDMNTAWTVLVAAIATLTAGMGTHEAIKQAAKLVPSSSAESPPTEPKQ